MVSDRAVGDQDDDQLYYTLIYLDQDKRVSPDTRRAANDGGPGAVREMWLVYRSCLLQEKLDIRLDHRAHIFQNLNGAKDEVELKLLDNSTYAQNIIYDTRAAVYHGNGGSKVS